MIWIVIIILCYLIGSFPSGYLVGKSQGIDIRQHGSGNIGATNVLRVMGKKWGYLVFLCDSLKGFLAVKAGVWLGASAAGDITLAGVVAGICCIIGHNYTVWLHFKGGKGIATSIGVLLAIVPVVIVLIVLIVWLAVFFIWKYVSLASIFAALSLPVAVLALFPLVAHGNSSLLSWPRQQSGDTAQISIVCFMEKKIALGASDSRYYAVRFFNQIQQFVAGAFCS